MTPRIAATKRSIIDRRNNPKHAPKTAPGVAGTQSWKYNASPISKWSHGIIVICSVLVEPLELGILWAMVYEVVRGGEQEGAQVSGIKRGFDRRFTGWVDVRFPSEVSERNGKVKIVSKTKKCRVAR